MLKQKRYVQIITALAPIDFVMFGILELFRETTKKKQYVLAKTDGHSKSKGAISTAFVTTKTVSCILLHDWTISYWAKIIVQQKMTQYLLPSSMLCSVNNTVQRN